MDTDMLIEKFARMNARAKVIGPRPNRQGRLTGPTFRIDIGRDRKGEFFELAVNPTELKEVIITDIQPRMRHLLLQVDRRDDKVERQKFLCGHDERHWFVAAVPESARASNVMTAMEALKPEAVKASQARAGLKRRDSHKRKNPAFVRQGEWFFIPQTNVTFDSKLILQNEPLSRGAGSKPHIVEELVRTGGETVYVSRRHPAGLTVEAYKKWVHQNPTLASQLRFTVMRRNADVYVRGKVRHSDHKTIVLNGWHMVVMNTESEARAMRHVAFLD